MNRLTVRSAFALLLLLTVLMLTLTCATATAANIRYIYYDQDGNWELLEAPIIEELRLQEGVVSLSNKKSRRAQFIS